MCAYFDTTSNVLSLFAAGKEPNNAAYQQQYTVFGKFTGTDSSGVESTVTSPGVNFNVHKVEDQNC